MCETWTFYLSEVRERVGGCKDPGNWELLPFRLWQTLEDTLLSQVGGSHKGVGREGKDAERKWNENLGIILKAVPHLFRTSLALDVLVSQGLAQPGPLVPISGREKGDVLSIGAVVWGSDRDPIILDRPRAFLPRLATTWITSRDDYI